MFDLEQLIRPNVKQLSPYSSARDEYKLAADVWLDANENCIPGDYNRYPDPHQEELKKAIATYKKVLPEQILLGNGSDEVIDLLFRAFCNPGIDKALIQSPTYGMYEVSAGINDVEVARVPLDADFQPDMDGISTYLSNERLKLIFFCSPNNPTGNVMQAELVLDIARRFHGLVVVDEAYIDLCPEHSLLPQLKEIPNLVVMQTFSKAWGLAGLRLGMAFASLAIIDVLKKIKPPYNINSYTQQQALLALQNADSVEQYRELITTQRALLKDALLQLSFVKKIYPSDANFLLVQVTEPDKTYQYLIDRGIVVRNRSSVVPGCLRITIGTEEENAQLITALKAFQA